MTFPCKENLIYFEDLERRQVRLFDDACDYGIPLSQVDLPEARRQLKEMLAVFAKDEFNYRKDSWGDEKLGGKEVSFFIPIEMDEGMESGISFTVGSNWGGSLNVNGDCGYFYVYTQRAHRPAKRAA